MKQSSWRLVSTTHKRPPSARRPGIGPHGGLAFCGRILPLSLYTSFASLSELYIPPFEASLYVDLRKSGWVAGVRFSNGSSFSPPVHTYPVCMCGGQRSIPRRTALNYQVPNQKPTPSGSTTTADTIRLWPPKSARGQLITYGY